MLTEYLAPLFRDNPLVYVDVGARFGIDPRWLKFGASLKGYCFEADKNGCPQSTDTVTYIPQAIAGRTGKATLYHTRYPESTGLYRTNEKFFNRLLNKDNAELLNTEEIDVLSMEDAVKKYGIPDIDFIKLDVEGAELDILKMTDLSGIFGVFTEFRFHAAINGSPAFSEMDQFLTNRGFMLYAIWTGRQSRKSRPYPGPALTFNDKRFHAGTNGGQVMDGDALYLRDPLLLKMDQIQILKAACMFEMFDLKDCAAELLIEREMDAGVDVLHCLDLLSDGSYKVFMESY